MHCLRRMKGEEGDIHLIWWFNLEGKMISIRENNVSQLINNWHTVADELLPASGEECERDCCETSGNLPLLSAFLLTITAPELLKAAKRNARTIKSTDEYKEAQHHVETDLISQQAGQGLLRLRIPAPSRTPWPPVGRFYQLPSWRYWMAHQRPLVWNGLVIRVLRVLFRKPNREDFHRPPSCIQSLGLTDLVSARCVLGNRADKLY